MRGVTPGVHDEGVTPGVHDEGVTPGVHDEGEVTPRLGGRSLQEFTMRGEVTPEVHDEGGGHSRVRLQGSDVKAFPTD